MSKPRPSVTGKKNPFYGKKHSKETLKKIAKILRKKFSGEKNPFYGKKHSEETRKKMSENHADFRGKKGPTYGMRWKMSKEAKRKISIAHLGKKLTFSHIKNISMAKLGKKNPMFGKRQSAKSQKKRSLSLKKAWALRKIGLGA